MILHGMKFRQVSKNTSLTLCDKGQHYEFLLGIVNVNTNNLGYFTDRQQKTLASAFPSVGACAFRLFFQATEG